MIALLLVFTAFSLSSFLAILLGSDPYSASTLVRVLFFTTLLLSMTGLLGLGGVWLSKIGGKQAVFEVVFRRALLLSALVVFLILLETFSVLNIFNALAIFLFTIGAEMFITYKSTKHNEEF